MPVHGGAAKEPTDAGPPQSLVDGFVRSARRDPSAAALVVGDQDVSYQELAADAARLAVATATLGSTGDVGAVLATRSRTGYAAVLGILAAGRGYLPLNPRFPVARTRDMLAASGANLLIVDAASCELLPQVLRGIIHPLTVLCPDGAVLPSVPGPHRLHPAEDMPRNCGALAAPRVCPDSTAYTMFTSGTTGRPKGVAVTQASACSYLGFMCRHLGAGPDDRFSQMFDLTFDLSVHDLFACWWSGACLVSVPHNEVMAPAGLIRGRRLTQWFSVPSVIRIMHRLGQLKEGHFPSLRRSLFCGEPLAEEDAAMWQRAAPNSTIENLYGPTEATIAVTVQRWKADDPAPARHGLVPIGRPFPGQRCLIVDEALQPVDADCSGELLLAGSQVAAGYLRDSAETGRCFVNLPGAPGVTWYRTGDLACSDADGCLHFLGRRDHQVQVRGYRVELAEIEHTLRQAAGGAAAVAVPWPPDTGRADEVYAFVAGAGLDPAGLLEACRALLPAYMLPRRVFPMAALPLGASGKIDRGALALRLQGLLRG